MTTKPCNTGVGIQRHACYVLQGSLAALRDDIDNRVDYALWQQRQAHEASLQQLLQQHAQELQLVVSRLYWHRDTIAYPGFLIPVMPDSLEVFLCFQ